MYDKDYAMYDIERYEFNVDDVEDEKNKNNIESLYKSINDYTEQKNMVGVLNNITLNQTNLKLTYNIIHHST